MTRIQKAKDLASQSYLGLWGSLPNPNRDFFKGKGVSFERAMREVSSLAEVEAAIIARKNAVLADEWQVVGKNDAAAQWLTEHLKALDPVYTFNAIYDAVWHGFAVLDIPLVKEGGRWVYQNIQSLPCDWFSFDVDGRLLFARGEDTARAPVNLMLGDMAREAELIQYYPSFTNPYGESQLARVFWPSTWLRGNMEYWSSYISRFADDSILAHTDGANPAKKAELLRAIMDFRSSGGLVTEGTETFEVLNTNKSASSMLFKDFAQACRESISKLILGHASALDSTPGKLGGEQNVALVREDIQQGDKRLIAGVMNSLIRHLCGINGITEAPEFVWVPEAEDEKALIERDKKLWDMGVRFSPEYIQKAYRLEEREFSIMDDAYAERAMDGGRSATAPTFAEGSRRSDIQSLTAPLDALENKHFKGFYKPFNAYNKRLLTALEKAEYWEDAFAAILQTPLETDGQGLQQDLLNAHIVGRGQVLEKIASLKGFADFADRGRDAEGAVRTGRDSGRYAPQYLDTTATARNWFTKKTSMTAEGFAKLDDELKQYAFTVAGLEKTEHISALAQKLTEAFDQGASYTSFKKSLAGLGPKVDTLTDARLRTVYRQNVFSAYSEGRYKQMMESVEYLPNWEYITIGDGRVRPAHAALNGTVRRYDDPFWNSWYPPNGFNCRCVVEVTTKEPSGNGTPSPRDGVYGSPAKDGRGLPSWNKELADKAAEAGSPMREIDRAQGTLTPDKGFGSNIAAYDKFIGDKLVKSYTSLNNLQNKINSLKGTEKGRISLMGDKKTIAVDGNAKLELFKGDGIENLRKQAEERLKAQGKDCLTIFDKHGNPVIIGKDMIRHIVEDNHDVKDVMMRLPYFKDIEKLITNAHTTVEDIARYSDSGEIIFQRYYYTKAGDKTIAVIVQWIRKDKGREISSIPAGATLIIQRGTIKQSGIRI